jgi:hypothetical protein
LADILDELYALPKRQVDYTTGGFDPLEIVKAGNLAANNALSGRAAITRERIESYNLEQDLKRLQIEREQGKTKGALAQEQYKWVLNPTTYLDQVAVMRGFKSYADAPTKEQKELYRLGESLATASKDVSVLAAYKANMQDPFKQGKASGTDDSLITYVTDPAISAAAGLAKGATGLVSLAGLAAETVGGTSIIADAGRATKNLARDATKVVDETQSKLLSNRANKFNKDLNEAIEKEDVGGTIKLLLSNPGALPQKFAEIMGSIYLPVGGAAKVGELATKSEFLSKVGSGIIEYGRKNATSGSLAEKALAKTILNTDIALKGSALAVGRGLAEASGAADEANQKALAYLTSEGIDPNSKQGRAFILKAETDAAAVAGAIGTATGRLFPGAEKAVTDLFTKGGRASLGNATKESLLSVGAATRAAGRVAGSAAAEGLEEALVSPAAEIGVANAKGKPLGGEEIIRAMNPAQAVLGAMFGGGTRLVRGTAERIAQRGQPATTEPLNESDQQTADTPQSVKDILDSTVTKEVQAIRETAELQDAYTQFLNEKTPIKEKEAIRDGLFAQVQASLLAQANDPALGYDDKQKADFLEEGRKLFNVQIAAESLLNSTYFTAEINDRYNKGRTFKFPSIEEGKPDVEMKLLPQDYAEITGAVLSKELRTGEGSELDFTKVLSPAFARKVLAQVDKVAEEQAAARVKQLASLSPEQRAEYDISQAKESAVSSFQERLDTDTQVPLSAKVTEITTALDKLLIKQSGGKKLTEAEVGRKQAAIEVLGGLLQQPDGSLDDATLDKMIRSVDQAYTKGASVTSAELQQIAKMEQVRAERAYAAALDESVRAAVAQDLATAKKAFAAAAANDAAKAKEELAKLNKNKAEQSILDEYNKQVENFEKGAREGVRPEIKIFLAKGLRAEADRLMKLSKIDEAMDLLDKADILDPPKVKEDGSQSKEEVAAIKSANAKLEAKAAVDKAVKEAKVEADKIFNREESEGGTATAVIEKVIGDLNRAKKGATVAQTTELTDSAAKLRAIIDSRKSEADARLKAEAKDKADRKVREDNARKSQTKEQQIESAKSALAEYIDEAKGINPASITPSQEGDIARRAEIVALKEEIKAKFDILKKLGVTTSLADRKSNEKIIATLDSAIQKLTPVKKKSVVSEPASTATAQQAASPAPTKVDKANKQTGIALIAQEKFDAAPTDGVVAKSLVDEGYGEPKKPNKAQRAQILKSINKLISVGLPPSLLSRVAGIEVFTPTSKEIAISTPAYHADGKIGISSVFLLSLQNGTATRSLEYVIAHEIAHVLDSNERTQDRPISNPGLISTRPVFAIVYADLYVAHAKNTSIAQELGYPFRAAGLNQSIKFHEAFAQGYALYLNRPDDLRNDAPSAYGFFDGLNKKELQNEQNATIQPIRTILRGQQRAVQRTQGTEAVRATSSGAGKERPGETLAEGVRDVVAGRVTEASKVIISNIQNTERLTNQFANILGATGGANATTTGGIRRTLADNARAKTEVASLGRTIADKTLSAYDYAFVPPTMLASAYQRLFKKGQIDGKQVDLMDAWLSALQGKAAFIDGTMNRIQQNIVNKISGDKNLDKLVEVMAQAQLALLNPTKKLSSLATKEQKEVKAKYDALTPQQKAVYVESVKLFEDLRDRKIKELEATLGQRKNISKEAKDALIEALTGGAIDGYLPIRRDGAWSLVVKAPDGKTVFFQKSDSEASLIDLKKKLEAEYKGKNYRISQPFKSQELYGNLDGASQRFVEGYLATINAAFEGSGDQNLKNELIEQLLVRHMRTSGRDSSLERKAVAFAQVDMIKGIIIEARKQALITGTITSRERTTEVIKQMEEQFEEAKFDDTISSQDRTTMGRALKMVKEHTSAVRADNQWMKVADRANALTNVMFLGLSPAAALINMTQLLQQTWPRLAGLNKKFGGVGYAREFYDSTIEAVRLPKFASQVKGTGPIADEQRRLLKMMEDLDISAPGDVTESINIASRGLDARGSNALQRALTFANAMNEKAERINRRATFLAAFRIAQKSGKSFDEAAKIGQDTVMATQFSGAEWNKTLAVKDDTTGVIRMAYTLKTYSISMYASIWSDLVNLKKNKNLTEAEKAEITRRLMGQLSVQVLLGGAFSIVTPISLATLNLVSATLSLTGADEDEMDWTLDGRIPEERIEQFVRSQFGDDAARVLTGGIPKLLGIDIRNNVQQDFFFRSPIVPAVGDQTFVQEKLKELLPVASVLQGFYNSAGSAAEGDFKKALKDFGQRGFGAAIRANDLVNNDGLILTKDGRIVADLSENALAPVLIAAGFNPTVASEGTRRRGSELLTGRQYSEAKRRVEDAAYVAVRISEISGDNSAQDAVEALVERFNEKFAKGDSAIALDYEKLIQSSQKKAAKEYERFLSGQAGSGSRAKDAYLKRELGNPSNADD